MVRDWDVFDPEAADVSGSAEVTRQTEKAHAWAIELVCRQWDPETSTSRWAVGGSRLRVLTPYEYVAEVRGQSAGGGHGKQGAHPDRIAELREIEMPVLMVFIDGGRAQWMWLDDPDVPIAWIDKDTVHKRMGWFVRDMNNTPKEAFLFPTVVPHFEQPSGLF
jgi:hypothetical protein